MRRIIDAQLGVVNEFFEDFANYFDRELGDIETSL